MMNVKKLVAQAGIAGALSLAALGSGAGLAHADGWGPQPVPGPGYPLRPGREYMPPPGDRNWAYPAGREDTHGMWRDAPWGDAGPPWGWGPPPRPDWDGALPAAWDSAPAPINYWGYNVQPYLEQ